MSFVSLRGFRSLGIAGLVLLAGCSLVGRGRDGREGPYLRPGSLAGQAGLPVAPVNGRIPFAVPAEMPVGGGGRALPRPAAPGAGSGSLPAGLVSGKGLLPLPGALLPGIGPVRAVVVSLSLGRETPVRVEEDLEGKFFGAGENPSAASVGAVLLGQSGGGFRFGATVLPTLVDSVAPRAESLEDPRSLYRIAAAALDHWAARTDLSVYDNDGPDGIPASEGSRDDDGRLDLVVVAIESDVAFPSLALREDRVIRTGNRRVRTGPLYVVSLPRHLGLPLRPAVGLVLDALGLDPAERFFPAGFPQALSTLARIRLGWLPAEVRTPDVEGSLIQGHAYLLPLADVPQGMGFWMVEWDGKEVLVSRVIRQLDGHFRTTDAEYFGAGAEKTLVLHRQMGVRGPVVRCSWPVGEGPRFLGSVRSTEGRKDVAAGATLMEDEGDPLLHPVSRP